jgi:hypothetical protein
MENTKDTKKVLLISEVLNKEEQKLRMLLDRKLDLQSQSEENQLMVDLQFPIVESLMSALKEAASII